MALLVLVLPHAVAAQRVTRADSSALGHALARYILAHPDVPLGGQLDRLIADTGSPTLTAYVGKALREIAPERWRGSPGDGDNVSVGFAIDTIRARGDTLIIHDSWTRCQAGASAGNVRAVHYQAVDGASGWTVVSHAGWLVGRAACS
jgi:hypothetical protein